MATDAPIDPYQINSEWYAALVAPILPGLADALGRLLPAPVPAGVAVDVGAGVGTALPMLRRAGARHLYAVEPSATMRVGLMTRVALDPQLRPSTTILPGTLDEQIDRLPSTWGAVVILNALGHLGVEEEDRLFAHVRHRLAPGGMLVIGLQPPLEPTDLPWTDFGAVDVGEHRLTTRGRAEAIGDDFVSWHMEWTLSDASGAVVDRRTQDFPWRTRSPEALDARAAAVGLAKGPAVPEQLLLTYCARSEK